MTVLSLPMSSVGGYQCCSILGDNDCAKSAHVGQCRWVPVFVQWLRSDSYYIRHTDGHC